jgi:Rps23 Pro-64 3,4-dihydroxylase Tpa1-like proline 4-hydroxylase
MVDKIKLVKIEKKKEGSNFINYNSFHAYKKQFNKAIPFRHIVLKNFLKTEVAEKVALEFPKFNSSDWQIYNNALEVKKLLNHWNKFGPMTYKLFYYLNSRAFIKKIEPLVGCRLFADFGINGGGLHTHRSGGKLNVHLDYYIHPKLNLERRLNLLIYITKNWKKKWGGHLGLWANDSTKKQPGKLIKQIAPIFKTAVLFDTTQNSWHGLPEKITCPKNVTRNSLAIYYLCEPRDKAVNRGKALFAPYKNQINDPGLLDLIKRRADISQSLKVYGDKK